MRVLLAFDKFKDSLTAREACEAAARALRAKHPDWRLDLCPMTDGGEGFTTTLAGQADGRIDQLQVTGPRGQPTRAPVGFVPTPSLTTAVRQRLAVTGTLAIADLASASGLALLSNRERDLWQTSTRGTGELLRFAASSGAAALLLGIGGSATNDLGLGALAALGLRCLRADGTAVAVPTPATWPEIVRLDGCVTLPPVYIACDVTNPLLGPQGATATYGLQKGLSAPDLPRLEAQMARLAATLCDHFGRPHALMQSPGAGAAGGIGFGLMVACDAKLVPGFDLVSAWLDLPRLLAAADLVLTGEGRFDRTSLTGKGPGQVVAEARRLGKTVHVFAGSLGIPADERTHAITPPDLPLPEALRRAGDLLAMSVGAIF